MDGARIGKNCKIFPGTVISAIPQDLKFDGEDTQTIIGDNTTLRECVTVNRGTKALGYTKVGSDCLIMATSHIAHDCIIGDNVIMQTVAESLVTWRSEILQLWVVCLQYSNLEK
jgi:UDP-N-acetylglucosamine acyltransferase